MNLRFEAAACKAPGTAERYRKLDIEARANLRARCLKAGVILDEPPT